MMAIRAVLYAAGLLFSLLMAGRLFAGKSRPSALFGTVMAAWAINCAVLLAMLAYFAVTGEPRAPWSGALLTANASLLAAAPAALYVLFPGGGHADN